MEDNKLLIPLNAHSIIPFLNEVGGNLQERGFQVEYIPQSEAHLRTAKRYISPKQLHTNYLSHQPEEDLTILLNRFDIPSARSVVFSQMVYDYKYPKPSHTSYIPEGPRTPEYSAYIDDLHRTLSYLDQLFRSNDGGHPIQYQGGEILRQGLQRVADYFDYSSVRFSFNPLPGRVSVRSSGSMEFGELEAVFDQSLTQQEKNRAKKYVESVRDKKPEVGKNNQNHNYLSDITSKLQKIRLQRENSLPMVINWVRSNISKKMIARIQRRHHLSKSRSKQLIEQEQYIFYPVHYYRESRITMRAPAFYNQGSLIEYLSRSLPSTYSLLTKDHPQQLGGLPLRTSRIISNYSQFLNPHVSAHNVIQNASAIITLNNTVGHEAIIWGKPLITLGDAFYDVCDLSFKIQDINDISTDLNQVVDSQGPSENKILHYVQGLYEISHPVEWGNRSSRNITMFADVIETRLN